MYIHTYTYIRINVYIHKHTYTHTHTHTHTHTQVLEHPWMTQCERKPRNDEIEEEVKQYIAGKVCGLCVRERGARAYVCV